MAPRSLTRRLFRDEFRTPSTSAECCFPDEEFGLQLAPLASQQAYPITGLRPQYARAKPVRRHNGRVLQRILRVDFREATRLLSTFERDSYYGPPQDLRHLDGSQRVGLNDARFLCLHPKFCMAQHLRHPKSPVPEAQRGPFPRHSSATDEHNVSRSCACRYVQVAPLARPPPELRAARMAGRTRSTTLANRFLAANTPMSFLGPGTST